MDSLLLLCFCALISLGKSDIEYIVKKNPQAGEHASISSALKIASDGDRITIGPGTFDGGENCNLEVNKYLHFEGAMSTIIDCQGYDHFLSGSTSLRLRNLRIRNAQNGAIWLSGVSRTLIDRVTLENNYGLLGAAIYCGDAVNLELSWSYFNYNNASTDGGAINFQGNRIEILGTTFKGNTAGNGGGAILFSGVYMETDKVVLLENRAGMYGGAVAFQNGKYYESSQTHFKDNVAGETGGAISFEFGKRLSIVKSILSGNKAKEAGGGIRISGASLFNEETMHLTSTDSKYEGNSAYIGAAIFAENVEVEVTGMNPKENYYQHTSDFGSNDASQDGGGIFLRDCSSQIFFTLFRNNSAPKGGALYLMGGDSTIEGVKLFDNFAEEGSGLYIKEGRGNFRNLKFDKNRTNKHKGSTGIYCRRATATLEKSRFVKFPKTENLRCKQCEFSSKMHQCTCENNCDNE